jgi:hypothetical protein
MTENRDLDPFTAEQLLSGGPVDGEVGPLADLLAAAAAPARADELTGEAAAVAAFRDAAGASRPAAATAVLTGSRRVLGLKVAIAVAAVAGAGIAGAAAAGVLPGGNSPAPVAVPASVTPGTTSSATGPAANTTSTPPDEQGGGKGPPDPSKAPSSAPTKSKPLHSPTKLPATPARPSKEIIAMCRAYTAFSRYDEGPSGPYTYPGQPDDRRSSDWMLDLPSFQPMVRAAGGKSEVPAYCKRVLTEDANSPGNRAPQVAVPPEQSDRPSGRPTSDPTSRPAASQTGTATTALPPPRGR